MSVCLSVRSNISETTLLNFVKLWQWLGLLLMAL